MLSESMSSAQGENDIDYELTRSCYKSMSSEFHQISVVRPQQSARLETDVSSRSITQSKSDTQKGETLELI